MNRREWIVGTAGVSAMSAMAQAPARKNIVIASANGKAACAKAMEMLKGGADTLDAVIAGVNINELDPNDSSVGYGGLPNEEGIVELDASVMHGPTRRCGSVASIRNIKTPSRVAKLVMEHTDHIMLVGDGASRFAKAWGMPLEDLLTEKARLAWLVWKQSLRDPNGGNNWTAGVDAPKSSASSTGMAALKRQFPEADEETLAFALHVAQYPITGTINCLALNTKGEMSGVTTTSGLSWKIPGRVGDSPIIGAGLFLDQDVGGAGSTGRGEENIRIGGAHTIVENMRHGMHPREAVLDALKRIARNFDNDHARLAKFDINFYALRKDGEYAGGTLRTPKGRPDGEHYRFFTVNDGGESRHEPCVHLLD